MLLDGPPPGMTSPNPFDQDSRRLERTLLDFIDNFHGGIYRQHPVVSDILQTASHRKPAPLRQVLQWIDVVWDISTIDVDGAVGHSSVHPPPQIVGRYLGRRQAWVEESCACHRILQHHGRHPEVRRALRELKDQAVHVHTLYIALRAGLTEDELEECSGSVEMR